MKILFWTDGFWPRIGGIETQGLKFIQSLQEKGHQCIVVAQKDKPSEKNEETYSGILIRRFDFNGIILKQNLKKLHPIEAYLDWAIKEFQIDVVHLNTCIGWSAFIFSLFRRKFTIPIVLTIHAPFYYHNTINPLVTKICSQVDQICCVSNWVLQKMKEQIVHRSLGLIYNGLPMFSTPPAPLNFSSPTFLLLGRFTSEKGFSTAIEAFAFLKNSHPNARLLIAGDGEERLELESIIEKFELSDSVEFTGPLTRDQVPHVINRVSIAIVPSYFESFGLTALEAMQMKRPVIASDVGGLPEIISDGKTGLLVPPKKPIALYKAMQTLLDHPEMAMEMGERGRCLAMEKFTLENHLAQYVNIYQKLIAENG